MGIDRVGKSGPVPVAPTSVGAREGMPEKPFEVSRTGASAPAASVGATSASPLERLRSGAIDLDGYVDAKVQEATAHLGGLPPSDLNMIRAALRERLATDPSLADLFKTATGSVAPLPDDE